MPTYHQPGPSGLPGSLQGATLWQSLVRSVPWVRAIPRNPHAAGLLAERLLPVAELLHAAAGAVQTLEVQLGESIDAHHRAMAAEAQLAEAHVLIAELVAALRDAWPRSCLPQGALGLIARAEAAILPPGL